MPTPKGKGQTLSRPRLSIVNSKQDGWYFSLTLPGEMCFFRSLDDCKTSLSTGLNQLFKDQVDIQQIDLDTGERKNYPGGLSVIRRKTDRSVSYTAPFDEKPKKAAKKKSR